MRQPEYDWMRGAVAQTLKHAAVGAGAVVVIVPEGVAVLYENGKHVLITIRDADIVQR